MSIDFYALSHYGSIASEAPCPVVITENRDGLVIRRSEDTPCNRPDAQDGEVVIGNVQAAVPRQLGPALYTYVHGAPRGHEYAREGLIAIADRLKQRIRETGCVARLRLRSNEKEVIRIQDWQRSQAHGVHKSKDRCINADSEGERQHSNRSESRGTPHSADCVAEVLPESIDERDTPRVAAFFFELFDSAKGQPSPPGRLRRIQTRLHVFFNLPLEVKPELLIHLVLYGLPPNQRPQPIEHNDPQVSRESKSHRSVVTGSMRAARTHGTYVAEADAAITKTMPIP